MIHDSAIQATHELKRARCLFSVRWPDGVARDYLVTPQMTSVLSVGPRLLELMAHMPAVTLPNEADPDLPLEGVYLDTTSNAVWMSAGELDPRQMTAVAQRWPGWHIEGHTEGLYRQVMLSGRDPSVVAVSAERAIHELVEDLASGQAIDPSAIYSALTRSEESPLQAAEGVRFGAGFFSADSPPLSAEERREVILRVLREKSANTDSGPQAK